MPTTFTEFLQKRAEQENVDGKGRQATVAEWTQAVRRLMDRLWEWIEQSDPNKILTVSRSVHEISEADLGRYMVSGLVIDGFNQRIRIVPKARQTVATVGPPFRPSIERAAGRVDITDGAKQFILYRVPNETNDVWLVEDTKGEPRVFDRAEFESALMSFLK